MQSTTHTEETKSLRRQLFQLTKASEKYAKSGAFDPPPIGRQEGVQKEGSTDMFSTLNRSLSHTSRKLVPLVALVAILAALAGTTPERADAATFSGGHWADLRVYCNSNNQIGGKTRELRIFSQASAGAEVYMQTRVYFNGVLDPSYSFMSWARVGKSVLGPVLLWPYSAPSVRVQVEVLFARVANGSVVEWSHEWGRHQTTYDGWIQSSNQSSCTLR